MTSNLIQSGRFGAPVSGWSQANIDALQVKLAPTTVINSGDLWKVYEVYADVSYGAGPSTVTLRPDGTVADGSADGSPWGAIFTNLHGDTSDDSDASYIFGGAGYDDGETSGASMGAVILSMGTFSFAGATIHSVTLRVRLGAVVGSPVFLVYQRVSGIDSAADTLANSGAIVTRTGATRTAPP